MRAVSIACASLIMIGASGSSLGASLDIFRIKADKCDAEPKSDRTLSGFRVQGVAGIVTALHGVAGCASITASTETYAEIYDDLIVKSVDIELDLAVLESRSKRVAAASYALGKQVRAREELTVLGFPLNVKSALPTRLTVRDVPFRQWQQMSPDAIQALAIRGSPSVSRQMISVEGGHLLPGHSGAPVLNKAGEVVGVGNGGLARGYAEIGLVAPLAQANFVDATTVAAKLSQLRAMPPGIVFSMPGKDSVQQARELLETRLAIPYNRDRFIQEARDGNDKVVSLFLSIGIDPNSTDKGKPSALMQAAQNGHVAVVNALLAAGADRRFRVAPGQDATVIRSAVESGSVATVLAVLGGSLSLPTLARDVDLMHEAMVQAASLNKPQVVKALWEVSPQLVNRKSAGGATPLHSAVHRNATASIRELLLRGAQQLPDSEGRTPVDLALALDSPAAFLALADGLKTDGTWSLWMAGGVRPGTSCSAIGAAISVDAASILDSILSDSLVNAKACGDLPPLHLALQRPAPRSLPVILMKEPLIRNPYSGAVPSSMPGVFYEIDRSNNSKLAQALVEASDPGRIALMKRGIYQFDTHLEGGLLTAAAHALDVDLIRQIVATGQVKVEGKCVGDVAPGPSGFPVQAALAAGASRASDPGALSRAKEIVTIFVGIDRKFGYVGCGWAPIRVAARNVELLRHIIELKADLGFAAHSMATVESVLLRNAPSTDYMLATGVNVCSVTPNVFYEEFPGFHPKSEVTALHAAVWVDDVPLLESFRAKRAEWLRTKAPTFGADCGGDDRDLLLDAACWRRSKTGYFLASKIQLARPGFGFGYQEHILCAAGRDATLAQRIIEKGGYIAPERLGKIKPGTLDAGVKSSLCSFYRSGRVNFDPTSQEDIRAFCGT